MIERHISVVYFSNVVERGGAEQHILTLLHGLDRNRFRAALVCSPNVAESMEPDLPADVALYALQLRKPTHLGAMARLARILRERRADILHSHQFLSSLYASPVGKLCGVPVIVETPHLREHWRQGWLTSRFFVDRAVGRLVDRYIAVSEANARYLVEQKGLPREKILVIHNGSDLARFDPEHQAPAGFRENLGYEAGDRVLVVLARLEPQKGHRVLLEAWPEVVREFPFARLACLGEGSLRGELEAQARALGIGDSVRFAGRQSNVEEWLALAEATLLPSFYEGLPLVAVESLAAGRPVVATAVDGTPEVVVNGKTGLTVPPGDPRALAQAICTMLREPDLRRQLAHAGHRWVREHFDERKQIAETQELYLTLCASRVPGLRAAQEGGVRPQPATARPAAAAEAARAQALEELICEEVSGLCAAQFAGALRGVILTGSVARREGTFTPTAQGWRLLGDAEFLLIFKSGHPLPSEETIRTLTRELEGRLQEKGLECHLSLVPSDAGYLQRIEPHIFGYELRTCGRVVWGEAQLLQLIPKFGASDLPREDAWEMLCNRMIEMLEVAAQLAPQPKTFPRDVFYRTVKLYLDMATSLLVFARAYQPTYRERAEALRKLAERPESAQAFPLDLGEFARRVTLCTEWKLSGASEDGRRGLTGENGRNFAFWEEAIHYAHQLWRWELEQLTNATAQATDRELLERWTRIQPAARRLRGWLHVVRRQGWHESWRDWLRWARHAWHASPRYWVYAAAGEVFFHLPGLVNPEAQAPAGHMNWRKLRSHLPVRRPAAQSTQPEEWQQVAAEIVANYQEFLVTTRS